MSRDAADDSLVKFCALVDGQLVPHRYPDIWERETAEEVPRLVIAPAADHVELLLALCQSMSEPFGLLYVLVAPRGKHEAGRYQAPRPLGRAEIEVFLRRFRAALEQDGRHHVWIQSHTSEEDLLVYDENNLVFAYGSLDSFERVLRERGLREGSVQVPVPHRVSFHQRFDLDEDAIIAEWAWEWSPLDEEQDDV